MEGERERERERCLTLRQGLSVCAPTMENPLPGLYFPPTAKAITVEKLLITKYCKTKNETHNKIILHNNVHVTSP